MPVLYLVAEDDISLPLSGMYELFERTLSAKKMVVLRRARASRTRGCDPSLDGPSACTTSASRPGRVRKKAPASGMFELSGFQEVPPDYEQTLTAIVKAYPAPGAGGK